jgi:hypothetical protein
VVPKIRSRRHSLWVDKQSIRKDNWAPTSEVDLLSFGLNKAVRFDYQSRVTIGERERRILVGSIHLNKNRRDFLITSTYQVVMN